MQNQSEFSKAFNGEDEAQMTPAPADESVNDGNKNEGSDPAASAPEQNGDTPAVAVVIDTEEAAKEFENPAAVAQEAAAEGEPVAEEMAEMESPEGDVDDEPMSPEDIQRQKSWEGRLKKREEELAARESAVSQAPVVDDAEVEEIKSRLSADFGDEFVQMISKVAAHSAAKSVPAVDDSEVKSVIAQAINDVQEAFQSMHFGQIADAHEDFQEIIGGEQFGKWMEELPDDRKQWAQSVIEGGRSGQIVKLLNQYKDSLQQDQSMSDEEDAAYGVSGSSGIKLPTRTPASGEDEYAQAWAAM
jgi:hypothetical protein